MSQTSRTKSFYHPFFDFLALFVACERPNPTFGAGFPEKPGNYSANGRTLRQPVGSDLKLNNSANLKVTDLAPEKRIPC